MVQRGSGKSRVWVLEVRYVQGASERLVEEVPRDVQCILACCSAQIHKNGFHGTERSRGLGSNRGLERCRQHEGSFRSCEKV